MTTTLRRDVMLARATSSALMRHDLSRKKIAAFIIKNIITTCPFTKRAE
jgi:hypothetical protein